MKKLGILVMAMVMVLGLSLGAFASEEEEIPINLNVGTFGNLIVPEDASFDLELDSMDGTSDTVEGIKVQSNEDFQMTIDNNFDPDEIGMDENDMWDADDGSDWIFSPNVIVENYPEEFGLSSNGETGKWDNVGSHDGDLVITGGENDQVYITGNSEYEFDLSYVMNVNEEEEWYDVEPEDYGNVGNVTVTISASQ